MILVCGGAGYIGSHTVRQLIDKGEEVIVVDNLETGYIEAVHPKAKFYNVDIRNEDDLNKVFEENEINEVIHFAANSLVGESMSNPLKYFNNNVHGTEVLLRVMIKYDVNKIVFSSTAATYGEPKSIPILESDETNPTNAYGETKLAIEKMIKCVDYANGIKYISLRYFNVAGAHESGQIGEAHNPETHIIPLVLQVPLGKREFISIYNQAVYVITDSFHGTAFAINFNIPFTTLLNPVSNINSRALSILKLTDTESRLIYDDGSNKEPNSLNVDYNSINAKIESLRKSSLNFLERNLL